MPRTNTESTMRRTRVVLIATLVTGIALGAIGTKALNAQQTGIKRAMLMKKELAGIEGKELVEKGKPLAVPVQ